MAPQNRLDVCLAALKGAGKKAFMPFVTAGFPTLDLFQKLLGGLPAAGADIIEIGMPFSDPVADGPAIQAANLQAFKNGITTAKILDLVKTFRKKYEDTPILLMGYYNPIYAYGVMRFLDDAKKAGVDGFIVPDLPPEEDAELREPAAKRGLKLIRLVTPTTDEKRLPKIVEKADGFLYYVSVAGITGGKSARAEDLRSSVERIRERTEMPVCIGFGVNEPAQAREMAAIADGVIVGSAIVKKIMAHIDEKGAVSPKAADEALAFVKSLAAATHGA